MTPTDVPEFGVPGVSIYSLKYWSRGILVQGYLDVPAGKGPFPLLVFLHGGYLVPSQLRHVYLVDSLQLIDPMQWASYRMIAFLPSYAGYGSSGGNVGSLASNATDTLNGIIALRQVCGLHIRPQATYLLGGSMGGGVAVYVAERDRGIRAAVLISPGLFNSPYWEQEYYNLKLPVLILAGTQDPIVTPALAVATYDALSAHDKKVRLMWEPGGHYPLAASWHDLTDWFASYGLTFVQSLSTRAPHIRMCPAQP